jgi:hypothetical protein
MVLVGVAAGCVQTLHGTHGRWADVEPAAHEADDANRCHHGINLS